MSGKTSNAPDACLQGLAEHDVTHVLLRAVSSQVKSRTYGLGLVLRLPLLSGNL